MHTRRGSGQGMVEDGAAVKKWLSDGKKLELRRNCG
jgi:hypothetical protein